MKNNSLLTVGSVIDPDGNHEETDVERQKEGGY
jgi:hypothetical protein